MIKAEIIRKLARRLHMQQARKAGAGSEKSTSLAPAGSVSLVGAGPGDPELLTLKAVRAIAAADVILVDDLVHPAVLEHVGPGARIIHVGKRGGCKSTPQEFIERLMIAEARQGRRVVRLKGGDPFIFGRGGEERAHLHEAGIAVEVVHGITSGVAAPGSLGIPLTHRDFSRGVIFVTGHPQRADESAAGGALAPHENRDDVDWRALAATGLTLVIYMGAARCRTIAEGLVAGGLSPQTPVAVVQSASTSAQKQLVTALGTLADDLEASSIGSPAIIVVGEVVRLAGVEQLSAWAGGALEEIS